MGSVFIEVVILWYDMLVTIWRAVSFQYIVVIPNVLQVRELLLMCDKEVIEV